MSRNPSVDAAFSEVTSNPPKVVQSTAKKFGAQRARKQQVAIALSKAGKSKFKSPKMKSNKY